MIFSEIYGAYYNTMAKIIEKAIDHPLEKGELRDLVNEYAFGESILNIESSIAEERWQLIKKDGTTPIKNVPSMPLSTLQKRWLKSISLDPRMKLFDDELCFDGVCGLKEVQPLFTAEDYYIFDKYSDGDCYENPEYIRNFRLILDAMRNRYLLKIAIKSRKRGILRVVVMPERLEYSEKDDKFRLIGAGRSHENTINLGRIISCEPYKGEFEVISKTRSSDGERIVEFQLVDERNALERVLLHFAHFKKEAERIEENRYKIRIAYDKNDETEILIRILSFGPMVKVTGPERFIDLIKDRLVKQRKNDKKCGE